MLSLFFSTPRRYQSFRTCAISKRTCVIRAEDHAVTVLLTIVKETRSSMVEVHCALPMQRAERELDQPVTNVV